MPRSVPAPDAEIELSRPDVTAPGEEGACPGARRHPVPLDAPDVALGGGGSGYWPMEKDYGVKGQKQSTHLQGVRVTQPDRADRW